MLILLLFALTGSMERVSYQCNTPDMRPALSRSAVADTSVAVCNYLCVAICSCEASAEAPVFFHDHKAVVRQRADARVAAAVACDVRIAMRIHPRALHPDAVDYYVFALERVLI